MEILPEEIIETIFTFLQARKVLLLERVCKAWRNIFQKEAFWKRLCIKEFGAKGSDIADIHSWKTLYYNLLVKCHHLDDKPLLGESSNYIWNSERLSISFWLYLIKDVEFDNLKPNYCTCVVSAGVPCFNNITYRIALNPYDNALSFAKYQSGIQKCRVLIPVDIPLFSWTHVVIVINHDEKFGYIDGNPVECQHLTESPYSFTYVENGFQDGSGIVLPMSRGTMAYINVYHNILSPTEVKYLTNQTPPSPFPKEKIKEFTALAWELQQNVAHGCHCDGCNVIIIGYSYDCPLCALRICGKCFNASVVNCAAAKTKQHNGHTVYSVKRNPVQLVVTTITKEILFEVNY